MKQNLKRVRRVKDIPSSPPLAPWVWLGLGNFATWRFLLLTSMVLASGITVVFMTHQHRYLFNDLQQLKSNANRLHVEWGQLLIEQSTFGLEGRIEQKAIEQLQMRLPDIASTVLVRHD